jgi:hypothetical protein
MTRRIDCLISLCSGLLASGCSVSRPVPVTPDAASLQGYLAEHPAADLRVTERSGRKYWVHAPEVRGDSLVGRRGYDTPARSVGVGLADVAELHTGHFSAGRTAGVVGGALAVAGVALLLVIEEAQPTY